MVTGAQTNKNQTAHRMEYNGQFRRKILSIGMFNNLLRKKERCEIFHDASEHMYGDVIVMWFLVGTHF